MAKTVKKRVFVAFVTALMALGLFAGLITFQLYSKDIYLYASSEVAAVEQSLVDDKNTTIIEDEIIPLVGPSATDATKEVNLALIGGVSAAAAILSVSAYQIFGRQED